MLAASGPAVNASPSVATVWSSRIAEAFHAVTNPGQENVMDAMARSMHWRARLVDRYAIATEAVHLAERLSDVAVAKANLERSCLWLADQL
jgi:hypothetical protein